MGDLIFENFKGSNEHPAPSNKKTEDKGGTPDRRYDMTAEDFFSDTGSSFTIDTFCNPAEKQFLLGLIEIYANQKAERAIKSSWSQAIKIIGDAWDAGFDSLYSKTPTDKETYLASLPQSTGVSAGEEIVFNKSDWDNFKSRLGDRSYQGLINIEDLVTITGELEDKSIKP